MICFVSRFTIAEEERRHERTYSVYWIFDYHRGVLSYLRSRARSMSSICACSGKSYYVLVRRRQTTIYFDHDRIGYRRYVISCYTNFVYWAKNRLFPSSCEL